MKSSAAAAASTAAMSHSTDLSALEKQSLEGLDGPDRARAEAQLKLQKQAEVNAFVSNVLKKLNDIAMSIINKIG